jgi:hypothetical protein
MQVVANTDDIECVKLDVNASIIGFLSSTTNALVLNLKSLETVVTTTWRTGDTNNNVSADFFFPLPEGSL